ncbi:MAG: 50S ribosomal protein L40e [Candidatus Heimdallarchaeota archaeon]
MPVHDPEKREIARSVLLHVAICRKCYARNPINAKKCRRCRSKRLRRKKTERT